MDSAKVSGYGIKVTAGDSRFVAKEIVANFGKANDAFSGYLQSSSGGSSETITFPLLALGFQQLIENEFPLLEFVVLSGSDLGSFAIVTRDSSIEVLDGVNPISQHTYNDFYDSHMLRLWVKEFLPGYEYDADWIFEDVHRDFVGVWKRQSSR